MRAGSPLRRRVAAAENRPAVYRMLDDDGDVLYVGKSVRLRSRLLSYLRAPPGEKARELLRRTAEIRWEYVPSEFAAVVRELRLIRRHLPPYNVEHRHLRPPVFLRLGPGPAPRLSPAAGIRRDGALYFGPLAGRRTAALLARELSDLLGLRDCPATTPIRFRDQTELFPVPDRPLCHRGEIGWCLAPCARGCGEGEYRERVAAARAFLEGRTDLPVRLAEARMRRAAARLHFEHAALLRDRAHRLRRARDLLLAFRGRVEGLSFLYPVPGYGGDDRIYLIRRGRIRGEFPPPRTPADRRAALRAVREVYRRPDPGAVHPTPDEAAEILLVARWFHRRPGELARTVPPAEWPGAS